MVTRAAVSPRSSATLSLLLAALKAVPSLRDAYLVGGFVRDRLLERSSQDIDLAVPGDALSMAATVAQALSGRAVALDPVRGVARVICHVEGEETCHLDISSLRDGIEEDLGQRDFTIDAMAVPLRDAASGDRVIIDPYGGLEDLARRKVRALGPGVFADDPVRLLRGVRLAAEMHLTLDGETMAWMKAGASLLTAVAAERINEEISRLLAVAGAARWLRRLDELGLLTVIIPDLQATKGASQPKEHHWNVFEHSLETVAALEALLGEAGPARRPWISALALEAVPWSADVEAHFRLATSGGRKRSAILKLAALLHDVAKPQTKTVQSDGRIRFLGHGKVGASMAAAIMERLRFSSREVRLVTDMVRYHMRPAQLSEAHATPSRRAIYRYFRDLGMVAVDTLFLCLADHMATAGPRLDMDQWQRHCQLTAHLLRCHFEADAVVAPPKLLDGHLLMANLGLQPGPLVGRLLETVREAQAAGAIASTEEALALAAGELTQRRGA